MRHFRQQLTSNTNPGSAKRCTDSHFTSPGRSLSKQKMGNVGAGDQQYKTDAAHQHEQCGSYIPRECVIECLQVNAKTRISTWVLPMQASCDLIEFVAGQPEADSIRQAD
jgi:hypothetical protein